MYITISTCVSIYLRIYVSIYLYIYLYLQTYIYIYIYTYCIYYNIPKCCIIALGNFIRVIVLQYFSTSYSKGIYSQLCETCYIS